MSTAETIDTKTAKKRKQWPRVRHVKGRPRPWLVDARINGTGERFFFQTATEADTKADQLRIGRKNTGNEGATLSSRLRADALEAERLLTPVGASLLEAVSYYLAHAKPAGGHRNVIETVHEFLAAKRNAGRKASYLDIQKYVLENVFAGRFGPRLIHEITASEIDEWMNGKPWTIRTRLNYFSDIRNLFGFAVRKGYRPTNPVEQLEKPTVTETSPGVLTVKQAQALLKVCAEGEAEMLPAVAIGLFAGLRTEELDLLDWKHVDLRQRNIHVPPEIAKTREGRDVEIHPTLRAWLLPHAQADGKLAPAKSYDWRLKTKALAAGITDWPKNALRHSFASYHFAAFKNAPLTSAMLGHHGSTQTFERRYKKRVSPADAVSYWNMKSTASRNVVAMVA
jgi:integrase